MRATYTMAKGCDHEIVRALVTHSKAGPCTIEIEFVWSWVNSHGPPNSKCKLPLSHDRLRSLLLKKI